MSQRFNKFNRIQYIRDPHLEDVPFTQGDPIPRVGEFAEPSVYLNGTVHRVSYLYPEKVIIITLGRPL